MEASPATQRNQRPSRNIPLAFQYRPAPRQNSWPLQWDTLFVFCPWFSLFGNQSKNWIVWFEVQAYGLPSWSHSCTTASWHLRWSTTCPVDPIPAPLLLDILGDLLPALSQIVNDSLLSGSFPSVFKHAILFRPLLKKSTLDHNTLVTTVKSKTFPSCPQSLRKSSAAAFRLFQFPWLTFSALPSLLTIHVTALRWLYSKWLTGFGLLWMVVMCPSRPFSICLLLSILSTIIFSSTDFNLSMVFLAPFFNGLSLTSLAGCRQWHFQWPEFKTCGCFLWCPTGLSSWSYPLHSLLCTSLLFDWNSFCLQLVFSWWHTVLQSYPPDQLHATILTMPACISDAKTWMTRNKLKLNNDRTQAFLVMSNRTILPGAQSTFLRVGTADRSRPVLATLVS